MSEYWKSLPRKFCDICKCWFADNKASIDFHERGKRHQENAQKRIQDIKKRGIKDAKKQKKIEDDMARIEKAALAAYKKDLQNNLEPVTSSPLGTLNIAAPDFQRNSIEKPEIKKEVVKPVQHFKHITTAKDKGSTNIVKEEKEEAIVDNKEKTERIWYEAVTDEGYKYYWNTENSESQWDPPKEGFISIEEQSSQTVIENAETVAVDNLPIKEEEESSEEEEDVVCSVGPQPKIDPYGNWVTIEQRVPEEVDLQLPKPSEDVVQVFIPLSKDETRLKFKEKVIGQLSGTDSSEKVTFKKRKFNENLKKNTRQRISDDD